MSDRLYKIDPDTGQVQQTLQAPGYETAGLAAEGKLLWVLDAAARRVYKLDPRSGVTKRALPVYCKSPQGLAFDGKTLWVADLKGRRLHQISTVDGTDLRDIPAPSVAPYGLAVEGGWLWVADRADDMIYQVDLQTGDVGVALHSPGPFPRGLACDGRTLWNVDYQADAIYRLKLRDPAPFVIERSKRETVEFFQTARNYGPGKIVSMDVYLAVPTNLPSQKILTPIRFTPKPDGFVTDQWGQKCARYRFENIPAGKAVTVSWKAEVELRRIRYFLFPEKAGSLSEIPAEIKARYLRDGAKYQIRDPFIRRLARQIVGGETNALRLARRIFGHLIRNMNYELSGGWNAAPKTLRRGNGSCSEFSFAFIALCRAAGLPARYVGSAVIRGEDASTDDVFHRWPEVYLPGYGWIPMDPSRGRALLARPADQAASIGYRDCRYLITTVSGGGSDFLDWEYNSNARWQTRGPCKVEIERFAEWSPQGASKK